MLRYRVIFEVKIKSKSFKWIIFNINKPKIFLYVVFMKGAHSSFFKLRAATIFPSIAERKVDFARVLRRPYTGVACTRTWSGNSQPLFLY
jgi:hypothetical protein